MSEVSLKNSDSIYSLPLQDRNAFCTQYLSIRRGMSYMKYPRSSLARVEHFANSLT